MIDLLVIGTLTFALFRGWKHGSIRESFSLLGLFVGIVAAVILVGPLARVLTSLSPLEVNVARLVSLGIIVGACALTGVLLGIKTAHGIRIPGPQRLDKAGGAMLAGIRSVLVVTLLLYALVAITAEAGPRIAPAVDRSISGRVLADPQAPFVVFYDSILNRSTDLQALTLWVRQRYQFRERVPSDRLDFDGTDAELALRRSAERAMFKALNRERAGLGLPALVWCEPCAAVARMHSKDMYRNGYFSHVDPDGNDPFERMRAARIPYDSAGENLAIAPSVREAHEGLMDSRDHRENILRAEFDEVGIGIFDGPYGLMCTQVFRAHAAGE